MNPNDEALAVAARIADGSGIDWALADATPAGADGRGVLSQLRAIAAVAAVHRAPVDELVPGVSPAGSHWGPLTLVGTIAEGRFGQVYRAWEPRLQRQVALKVLHATSMETAASPTRAIDEARLLARVKHPNVLTVHGAECLDGQVGIWTEFIEGRTLESLVAAHGPLPPAEVVTIGIDLCRALAAVHGAGLLHRDVKAQNIMRETGGRIVLMDFGTVHDLDRLPPREGDLSGTPLYLAPEIFAGGAPSISSDVYALAVLCFYLLTGRHPVPGRTLEDVRTGHRLSPPARLRDIRPDVPEALAAAIERGLAADPAKRHANARTFELALEAARVSPTEAAPSPTPRSARLRTRPALIAAAATLVVLSAAYFVWGLASKTAFRARDWVLVTSFDNRTGDDQFTGVLEHALEYELSNSAYVNVVPRERVDDALRLMARPVTTVVSASVGPEIALRDGGIRFVLDGAIEPIGTGYAMTVRVVDPRTGRSMATAREEAPGPAAVPAAVRSLSNWVRGRFGEAPAAIAQDAAGLEKVRTPSLRALRDYSDAVHAFHLADYDEAEKLLRLALAEDPGFASAHARLGWTLLSLKRPRKEYVAEFGRAADLAGSATEREQYAILGALHQWTYETDRAIEQYEALVRRYPDDTSGLSNLQKLYRAAGRRDQVTELMARIADALPHDFVAQTGYAQALVESSGLDAARPQVSRAQSLFSTAPTHFDGAVGPVRSWVLMFPAHELWVQGRAQAASAVLDALWARPELDAEGFVAETILEKLRLALGQLRLATDASARINTQPYKGIVLAELALARDDPKAIVALLGSGQASDFGAVSLLVRAGDLDAAERLLRRLPNTPLHSQWAADEIAEARGENSFLVREALKAGVPWTRVMTGMRAFLYSETLARAAVQIGDVPGAIRVLEDTAPLGEKAYPPNMQSGYYWMRTQALLATLYRQNGQLEQARAIERNLLTALAMADADYPLLVELKKTVGG